MYIVELKFNNIEGPIPKSKFGNKHTNFETWNKQWDPYAFPQSCMTVTISKIRFGGQLVGKSAMEQYSPIEKNAWLGGPNDSNRVLSKRGPS